MVTQKQVEAACEAMFNSAGKSCTRCGVPYSTGFGCGFWAVPEMKFIAEYVLDRSLPLMEGAQEMAKVIFESKLIVPDSMEEWQRQQGEVRHDKPAISGSVHLIVGICLIAGGIVALILFSR